MHAIAAILLALAAQPGLAHMYMQKPPALGSKDNDKTQEKDIDYSLTSPLAGGGSNFPCKGLHKLLGTPSGATVATWRAGSTQEMVIVGGARHNGGSCQASLSYDKGNTWKVIHSWIGDCPKASGASLSFKIPSDAPSGNDVLLAWSWINNTGNREFYMNCAVVNIAGGGGRESVAFSSRPAMFVANLGNGCTTKEGVDPDFPDPGPNVSRVGASIGAPSGSCGKTGSKQPEVHEGDGSPQNPGTSTTPTGSETIEPGGSSETVGGSADPTQPGSGSKPQDHDNEGFAGHTPGNDWPEDFRPWGAASKVSGSGRILAVWVPLAAAIAGLW